MQIDGDDIGQCISAKRIKANTYVPGWDSWEWRLRDNIWHAGSLFRSTLGIIIWEREGMEAEMGKM